MYNSKLYRIHRSKAVYITALLLAFKMLNEKLYIMKQYTSTHALTHITLLDVSIIWCIHFKVM